MVTIENLTPEKTAQLLEAVEILLILHKSGALGCDIIPEDAKCIVTVE